MKMLNINYEKHLRFIYLYNTNYTFFYNNLFHKNARLRNAKKVKNMLRSHRD